MSVFPIAFTLFAPDGRVIGRRSARNAEEANTLFTAARRRHGEDVRVECELSDKQRINLLAEVYGAVVRGVESLEHDDRVGPDLAYLLGSLLNGTYCEWPEGRPILGVLRANFPAGHPVFSFVQVEKE